MKIFTTIKVGYTAGTYGCSNEFFTTIIVDENGMSSVSFKGMYGVEDRVAAALKEKGYDHKWTPSDFGRMNTREVNKNLFLYENQAIEKIKAL